MTVKPPSLLRVFTTVERRASPRVEACVRSDLFLDTVAIANSVSRRAVRMVEGTLASALETVGVPSARQVWPQLSLMESLRVAKLLPRALGPRPFEVRGSEHRLAAPAQPRKEQTDSAQICDSSTTLPEREIRNRMARIHRSAGNCRPILASGAGVLFS